MRVMRLFPKNETFYDLLDRHVENLEQMAARFVDLLQEYRDVESKQAAIKELEHVGDSVTQQLLRQMHVTFVTPLDKEDIVALCSGLDDISDYIDAAAERLVLYKIPQPTREAVELGSLLAQTVDAVAVTVRHLRNLEERERLFDLFRKIHSLENQSDTVYRRALGELFNDPHADPVRILKWKEVYERMERAVDECEDVANVVESIVLKYG